MNPRHDRLKRVREKGFDPYPARCHKKTPIGPLKEKGATSAWVAGRLVKLESERKKSLEVQDMSGTLACHVEAGDCSEGLDILDLLELGDLVEVQVERRGGGYHVQKIILLAKALRPLDGANFLPEPSVMYRRAAILWTIRNFFDARGFLEVETPLLQEAGDPSPHLHPFFTEYWHPSGRRTCCLPTSPEFPMKRLLGAGYERIYQISKFFRNAERSPLHNPEFTGIEWYEAYEDYEEAMRTTETLLQNVCQETLGQKHFKYQGKEVDFSVFERLSVDEAFLRYAEIDLERCGERGRLAEAAASRGVHVALDDTWEDLFFKVSLQFVEPRLGQGRPTLLYDYPCPLAMLAKRKRSCPRVAERFEVYIAGLEVANGYTELNDPQEQRARWQEAQRRSAGFRDRPVPLDEALLAAMEAGIPPAAGVAMGADRVVMLLADRPSIQEVLFFPFSESPQGGVAAPQKTQKKAVPLS